MAQQQVSPQVRAANFSTLTRQTFQTMPTKIVQGEQTSVEFDLPKVRLLNRVVFEVEAVANLKSSNATIPLSTFSPYSILRRVSLELNNGFSPYVISGREILMYNMSRMYPDVLFPQSSERGMVYVENGASAGGTDRKIKFRVELPLTLNDRDPVGLILLQNAETSVQLKMDIDKLENAYVKAAGDVITFKSMSVTPLLETFTIPPVEQAVPDISVLKLVQSRSEQFAGNGQNLIKLQTGTIYRKLALYFEDLDGNPLADSDFNGNLELVFNSADIPYSIKPSILAAKNHSQLGFPLPKGMYLFDFSNQGIPNFGGSRDYIDTERLTQFEVRFSTTKNGKMSAISETLSKLQ